MGVCIVGWAHTRFGRLVALDLESLISCVRREALSHARVSMYVLAEMQLMGEAGDMQVPGAELAGLFNMGGPAVASYVSILERQR